MGFTFLSIFFIWHAVLKLLGRGVGISSYFSVLSVKDIKTSSERANKRGGAGLKPLTLSGAESQSIGVCCKLVLNQWKLIILMEGEIKFTLLFYFTLC
jgi:hypothetical protein